VLSKYHLDALCKKFGKKVSLQCNNRRLQAAVWPATFGDCSSQYEKNIWCVRIQGESWEEAGKYTTMAHKCHHIVSKWFLTGTTSLKAVRDVVSPPGIFNQIIPNSPIIKQVFYFNINIYLNYYCYLLNNKLYSSINKTRLTR
jgi:hypothetical protein